VRNLSLLPLFGLVFASDAQAVELYGTGPFASSTLLINSSSYLRYRHVDDKLPSFEDLNLLDYIEQVQRVSLTLSKDRLTIGARFDEVALFANRYILDDELYYDWTLYDPTIRSPFPSALFMLEKSYLTYKWDNLEVAVGDTYASFGRGIALNVVRNSGLDIDTSLRGAKMELSRGDFLLSAVSGLTNRQQINRLNINVGLDKDIPHMISGLRLEHFALGPAQAGIHGVVTRFGREVDREASAILRYEEQPDALIGGANIEAFGILGVDWYLESDFFRYQTVEIAGQDDPLNGWIVYGSATMYPGLVTILAEGKVSKNTERINAFISSDNWEMSTPPPLEYERVITEDSAASVNSNDIFGGRVRADLSLSGGSIIPYTSLMVLRDLDTTGLHFNSTPETIFHPIAGGQFFPSNKILIFNGGYRRDIRDDVAEGVDQLMHLDGEFSTPTFGDEGLELAVSVRRFKWGNNPQGQEDFISMENAVVWKRGEKLDLILYQDWTDNPLIPALGNTSVLVEPLFSADWGKNLYVVFEAQYKPTSASQFTALIGAYKAGIRCSGGQCRTLPGFNGVELTYTTQF
jgi:hypothetical protein